MALESENCGQYLIKMAIKHNNDEMLMISLKYVMSHTSHANPLGTQKIRAITHGTAKKHENHEFLVITLKHVSGLKIAVNRPRNQKLWVITHENG